MHTKRILLVSTAVAVLAGCAGLAMKKSDAEYDAQAQALLKSSFREQGQAKLDRLDQDDVQKLCSQSAGKAMPREVAARIEAEQQKLVKLPADGKLLGDWKAGERIAQTGVGMQYTDDPSAPAGGNCYACHQLTKAEVAFGTIGPSLYNFGKLRGFTPDMQKYAYSKVWNSEAFAACSSMPRFGHKGILTEQQVKDVTALLMDPESPVNK
jgi:sulfur-oxidizing protein SoxX